MNPYEVLGVPESASQEEIKKAYRELVKKYHPDQYQNNPLADLAEEKLREVNEAYDMLTKEGASSGSYGGSSYGGGSYGGYGNAGGYGRGRSTNDPIFQEIRRDIDTNQLAQAEQKLNNISIKNAEWIFLSGVISYKRGYYDDALSKFNQACSMDPNNIEYRRTLNTLQSRTGGYYRTGQQMSYDPATDAMCTACQLALCSSMCCRF